MTNSGNSKSDPDQFAPEVKRMLNDTIVHLREDVRATDHPQAQALFETTAEVLKGLVTAYDHLEEHTEEVEVVIRATSILPARAGRASP